MNELKQIELAGGYLIRLKFKDGLEKVVDFKPFLGKGFTADLLQPNRFRDAFIEDGGGLAWPNGYDFCPNYLHDYVPAVEPEKA